LKKYFWKEAQDESLLLKNILKKTKQRGSIFLRYIKNETQYEKEKKIWDKYLTLKHKKM